MDYSPSNNKRNRRKQRPHVDRVRNSVGVLVFRAIFAAVMIGGFALAGAGIGVYLGILRNAPELNMNQPGIYTSFVICGETGEELVRLSGDQHRIPVSITYMPQHLLDAFVAIEDERFHTHNGIDFRGIARAFHNNLTSDTTEGASTITQQLIKNHLGLHRNDLISKLQEQYLALQYERYMYERLGCVELVKAHILESYLNMINLGHNWHGVQIAALNYFNKDVSELTISESAALAAITRNPSWYNPSRFPTNNRYRQILVLENMRRLGMITEREFREAYADPVHERVQPRLLGGVGQIHDHYTDALILQVHGDLMDRFDLSSETAWTWIYEHGLRIYSNQDRRMQEIVDEVFMDFAVLRELSITIEYHVTFHNAITNRPAHQTRSGSVRNRDQIEGWIEAARNDILTANDTILHQRYILTPQPQAAFVLLDHHTGRVLAINGGRGDKTDNMTFCRATTSTRSPGSQFKVLAAFAPGIDMGSLTAATHIPDEPWTFSDGFSAPYTPVNWWGSHWEGLSSVRRAIYRSMNVVSARAFQYVGPEDAFQYLINFGFTTLEGTLPNGREFRDTHASVPLGGLTLGVTQLETAAAYGTIANLGIYNRPMFYSRVVDRHGNIILDSRNEAPRRVLSEPAAYILTHTMLDTMTASGATGGDARFRNLRMPVSGKTGTSQRVNDQGFSASTPHLTATIWVGFDRPQTLHINNAHLVMWRMIMERIHVEYELPVMNFPRPDGVVHGTICRDSGLAMTDLCRQAARGASDLFMVGTIPTTPCHVHQSRRVCYVSGRPPSHYCPPEYVVNRIVAVRFTDPENDSEGAVCDFHGPHTLMPQHPPDWGFSDGGNFPAFPSLPNNPDWGLPTPTPVPTPSAPWDIPNLPAENIPAPNIPIPNLPAETPVPPPPDDMIIIPPAEPPPEENEETPPSWFAMTRGSNIVSYCCEIDGTCPL